MRVLIQRVLRASVRVGNEVVGSIGQGHLLFVGVEKGDGPTQVEQAVAKLIKLRLFEDDNGKTNLNLLQVAGQALVVSQFTLAASLKRGNRPSFDAAAAPQLAEALYLDLVQGLKNQGVAVETGRFGADMKVELVNDGPATYTLEILSDDNAV